MPKKKQVLPLPRRGAGGEEKKSAPRKKSSPPLKQAEKNFDWKHWLAMLVIAVVTFICFSPTLKNDFTNWDDEVYVANNPVVTGKTIPYAEIFKTPVSLNYHPLTILTLAWNYQSAGLNAHAFLLTNIWLHVINSVLVFLFIFFLTDRRWIAAAIAGLWFGIHPMHVESVSWVAERKDVLYTFFFLASCIAYLKFLEKKKWWLYGVSFLLFTASVLSKAMAVVLPMVLLLIDYLKGRKFDRRVILEKVPFLVVSLVFGTIAFVVQSREAIADIHVFTVFQRAMFASYGLIMYIVKFFAPLQLSAFYPYPTLDKNGNIPLLFYLVPFAVMAIIALVVFKFRKSRFVIFGLLFFFFTVALVLQFITVGSALMADRYSYLSYIGLLFIVGVVADKILTAYSSSGKFSFGKIITVTLLGAFSVFFFTQAYQRTQVWKNSETLWTDVINKYPMQVEVSYKNRGTYYGKHNRIDDAYKDYQVLMQMNSKDSKVYSNLGNIYGIQKKFPEAISTFTKAIEMDSKNFEAYVNRGITYSVMGDFEKALSDYNVAQQLDPNSPDVYANRGIALYYMGENEKAIDDLNRYLQSRSDDANAYYFRGMANYKSGHTDQAKQDLSRAQQMGYKGDFSLLKM